MRADEFLSRASPEVAHLRTGGAVRYFRRTHGPEWILWQKRPLLDVCGANHGWRMVDLADALVCSGNALGCEYGSGGSWYSSVHHVGGTRSRRSAEPSVLYAQT